MQVFDNQIKYYTYLLDSKIQEEPLKLFKKAHNKWEEEVNSLEEKLYSVYMNLEDEFISQRNFYNALNSSSEKAQLN